MLTQAEVAQRMADKYPRDDRGRFTVGNPGGGRRKGSRNKLGHSFLAELDRAFAVNGRDAIKRVVDDNPAVFLRLVASLLPKEMSVTANRFEEMSDDDLQRYIDEIERSIEALAGPEDRQGGGT